MRFSHDGKQIRRSTETSDKQLAEKIHAKVLLQIVEGKWFDKPACEDKTLQDMLDKYLAEYTISKTESGQPRDGTNAKHLKAFFGNPLLKEITPPKIVDYKAWRRREGKAPATIERELCLLKRGFTLAIREWEWVTDNPVLKVSKERFNNQIDRWLSVNEERRLLEACPDRVREIVIFALNTGMKQGEILDLKWPYVDLKRRTATVMKSKTEQLSGFCC